MSGEVDQANAVRGMLDRGGLVKICGLREPEHAAIAVAAGADMVGFIFAPARRQVTAAAARACVEAARQAAGERRVLAVGVFVDAPARDIERIAAEAGLDAVQLHGAEPPTLVAALSMPAIKVLRPRGDQTARDVLATIEEYVAAGRPPVGFLLDGFEEGMMGGTGARADWQLAAEVNASRPIVLAGGLDPENVAEAIRQVRPIAVDVSSGVETAGTKDPARIEAFVQAARRAFANSRSSWQPPSR